MGIGEGGVAAVAVVDAEEIALSAAKLGGSAHR